MSKLSVSRAELIALANEKGVKPKFLFPEERQSGDANISKQLKQNLSSKERENLYRIIGGLVLLVIEQQSGKRFGIPTKVNRAAFFQELPRVLQDVEARTDGASKGNVYKVIPENVFEALGISENSN